MIAAVFLCAGAGRVGAQRPVSYASVLGELVRSGPLPAAPHGGPFAISPEDTPKPKGKAFVRIDAKRFSGDAFCRGVPRLPYSTIITGVVIFRPLNSAASDPC